MLPLKQSKTNKQTQKYSACVGSLLRHLTGLGRKQDLKETACNETELQRIDCICSVDERLYGNTVHLDKLFWSFIDVKTPTDGKMEAKCDLAFVKTSSRRKSQRSTVCGVIRETRLKITRVNLPSFMFTPIQLSTKILISDSPVT